MRRDFRSVFRTIPGLLREELPPDLREFHWTAWSSQAKAWYGNRDLHYEIWVRSSLRVVELGLHFEADELTNARLLGAFRARAKQVSRALGPGPRIEEWDRGWARVWEPIPLQSIDDAYAERVTGRFLAYVRALEPILRDELPREVEWNVRAEGPPAAERKRAARGSYSRASRSAR